MSKGSSKERKVYTDIDFDDFKTVNDVIAFDWEPYASDCIPLLRVGFVDLYYESTHDMSELEEIIYGYLLAHPDMPIEDCYWDDDTYFAFVIRPLFKNE
jgi:hypothetical protein